MSKKTKAEERAAKAAALVAERKRKERRRNVLTAIGVVLLMVAIVGGGFLLSRGEDEAQDEGISATSEFAVSIGDEDAPHTIVIYEDFLCPICRQFEAASRDDLARLAEDGQVYVSYRPFNLFSSPGDPRKEYSVAAAATFGVVLEESGPEVAKEFHDLLFENQPSETGPFPDTDALVDLAVQAGADEDAVREGIENGDGEDWVADATAAAKERGIDATPTIFLDGEEFRSGRTMEEVAENLVAAVS